MTTITTYKQLLNLVSRHKDTARTNKLREIFDDMPEYAQRGLEYWVSMDLSLPAFSIGPLPKLPTVAAVTGLIGEETARLQGLSDEQKVRESQTLLECIGYLQSHQKV